MKQINILLENHMFHIFFYVPFILMFGILLSLFTGWIFGDSQLQNGLKVVIKAFLRITEKKWWRLVSPSVDILRVQRDQEFINLPVDQKAGLVDTRAMEMVTELKQRLCSRFGNQVESIYLLGSRARGDYQPESDVDVGIFLGKFFDRTDLLRKEVLYQTSELLLKYGLFIQPRIFEQNYSSKSIDKAENYLAQIVISYGIPI